MGLGRQKRIGNKKISPTTVLHTNLLQYIMINYYYFIIIIIIAIIIISIIIIIIN